MRIRMILLLSLFWMSCGSGSDKKDTANEKEQLPPPKLIEEKVDTALAGSWELVELPQASVPINQLFPRQHPMILIQPQMKLISGTTGCNRFSATITSDGNRLDIIDLTRSTLVCAGEAEPSFLKAMENAKQYTFRSPDVMAWGTDSLTWMILKRK